MPNTLLTSQVITNELLRRFKNNLGFSGAIAHTWNDKFAVEGAKIGDTLRLRDPVRFVPQDGPVLTPQDVTETQKVLVLNKQVVVGFSFSSKDLTLSIDNFRERYLDSAAVALANRVDVDGLTMAFSTTPNQVGVPGTPPTDLGPFWEAGEVLDVNSAPMDGMRTIVYPPKLGTAALKAAQGLFQSSVQIRNQYERGRMGIMGGFEWVMDQNCRTAIVGAHGGAAQVTVANQTGSTLAVSGLTPLGAPNMRKGDIFTLPNVFGVNAVSGDPWQSLRQFVVTADVSADGSGNASVPIYPSIITSGPYRTVTVSPAAGAPLTWVGTPNQQYPTGIAFHRDAYVIGMAPLEVPRNVQFGANQQDPDTGCAIRMVAQYDIINDLFITRCDVLYGHAAPRPEWGVRIAS
ncbi:MAG TPA: P22 phage major capsid protein family protein [Gemmataceae bacterium]|nr:P22 phage major capsid protein family protein [Gemmataceae bacterium]